MHRDADGPSVDDKNNIDAIPPTHDPTRHIRLDLTRRRPRKTLDVGLGGTSVSVDPLGRILQLSTFHPQHGVVVAAPFEQFNGANFRKPEYVRAYRSRMLDMIKSDHPGFGIRFEGGPPECYVDIQGLNRAVITYQLQEQLSVSVTLVVHGDGRVTQTAVLSSRAAVPVTVNYLLGLGLSVNRASYGQLTEAGPIPIPPLENRLQFLDGGTRFLIDNRNLGASIEGGMSVDDHDFHLKGVQSGVFSTKLSAEFATSVEVPAGGRKVLLARFKLRPAAESTEAPAVVKCAIARELSGTPQWKNDAGAATFIIRRNLEYILGCCAIPVGARGIALITDHVALPLGWNRDNYWQVRFLLDMHRKRSEYLYPDAAQSYSELIRKTVKGHLHWVFRIAQRPEGFWHRSYLVTGAPKDGPVFQLDQQCYPLLEICDFLETFPEEINFVKDILEENTADQVIQLIKSRRDGETQLYPTEETPADDAVEYPFHFSSHVLLWYTLSRTAKAVDMIDSRGRLVSADLLLDAELVRSATLRHFVATNAKTNQEMWAYLVSGKGEYRFYHDANDVPTLYAPLWGFATTKCDIRLWYNTMRFGISADNVEAYSTGKPFGGLGSVHTPGPWPLGYFQEFTFAQMTGDKIAETDAWGKLTAAMSWDGLFSEAVDQYTAECTSKAWFSWPGSMIGSAILRSQSPSLHPRD